MGLFGLEYVHSGAMGFVGFRVLVGSLGRALGSSGSSARSVVRVHSGARGFNHARLGVVEFIQVRVGSLICDHSS